MPYPRRCLVERLNEQLSSVLDSGFAHGVKIDPADPTEETLERRINAVIDAARARAIDLGPSDPARLEKHELAWALDSLIENVPVMLFVKNAQDLTVALWNKRSEELSGVKAADILGKTGLESFPLEQVEFFQKHDRTVLEGRRLVAYDEAITSPDGAVRWISSKKIPLLDETGEPRYLLGISEDVTERRLATAELRSAKEAAEVGNQVKTEFLANISHELRTPLTLILGPAGDSLADTETPLPPRQVERVETIHRNARRLLKLVNTLLDFSRVEASRTQASFEREDLSALTVDLASQFRSAIERAGLRLVVDVSPVPVDVDVDREMWEKIVFNLLSNALKFTFDGEIRVSLRTTAEHVRLEVRDTGTGIPPDEVPRIFERFHRVRAARSRTHEGTGIGLALVRELVGFHGGTIGAESEVGKGTTIAVTIPRRAALAAENRAGARGLTSTALGAAPFVEEALAWLPEPGAPPAVDTDARGRARILVAEDNADMRSYIVSLLSPRWDVTGVANGMEALRAARRAPPDLVLSDAMMPELDGAGLLRALREDERTRPIPMILVSARAGERATIEGWEAGADDYLVKPFSARELVARVRTALTLAELRRALEEKQRASTAAEEANRIKDEFLATVSHELRTPLTAIMGWASILSGPLPNAATLAKGLAIIGRNAQAQKTIIDDILDMSRVITGRLRIEQESLDLDAVVRDALDTMRPSADTKALDLTYQGEPCPVVGDPQRLRQIVCNVITNAIKFTPAHGRVGVRLDRAGDVATLRITDTGEGIAPSILPHIFDRFRQADSSITRRHGGLGLGLSIVQHLVALHGGAVCAESPGLGFGATFTITLPLCALAPAPARGEREDDATERDERALESVRVLVVDDAEDTRDLVRAYLALSGAVVATAGTADEALVAFSRFHPDVLVSDIGMPGEDGISMLGRIRGTPLGQRIPAIALSAHAGANDVARALAAGFQRHLPKPIDAATLARTVAEVRGAV